MSGWGDLNSRPLRPERSALAVLRYIPSLNVQFPGKGSFGNYFLSKPVKKPTKKSLAEIKDDGYQLTP